MLRIETTRSFPTIAARPSPPAAQHERVDLTEIERPHLCTPNNGIRRKTDDDFRPIQTPGEIRIKFLQDMILEQLAAGSVD